MVGTQIVVVALTSDVFGATSSNGPLKLSDLQASRSDNTLPQRFNAPAAAAAV